MPRARSKSARSARPAKRATRAKRGTQAPPVNLAGMLVSREARLKIFTNVIKYANESLTKAKREKNASDIAFFTEKIETAREFYRRIYALKPHTTWPVTERLP